MGEWDIILQRKLSENNIIIEEAARYVDDVRVIMKAISRGWRWAGKRIEYKEKWKLEKDKEDLTCTVKTASVVQDVMNSIMTNIQFTTETLEDFPDRVLPTLDTKLWVQNGRILYSFTMKNQCPIN